MTYYKKIEKLLAEMDQSVKDLLDPAKQKRSFPKTELAKFLKKKGVLAKIEGKVPEAITALAESKEKQLLVPTDILRAFFADQDIWDMLPKKVRNSIEKGRDPRVPTQGSSDFIINRELGDWAERTVLNAVNDAQTGVKAVRYGRQDTLVAGEEGFDELFREHQTELKKIGKRPDLLIYKNGTVPNEPFASKSAEELISFAKQADAGFEVRSSQQAMKNDDRLEKLSFTPKIEDIHHVVQWIKTHNVPHFYVQLLFGRVYAIPFATILKVLKNSPKSGGYRIARLARNQFKSTIYIPLSKGVLLSSNFEAPAKLTATTMELPNGRVVVVVTFDGGKIELSKKALTELLADSAN